MYLSTLVCALLREPVYADLLRASVAMTIIVPVILYAYILVYRLLKNNREEGSRGEKDEDS
ncbi:MAG: hypothetical protein K6B28_00765 [Lachnospiraceae bacterium]|nr:hypothetical protein [Lachnospiraceae bacterium]